MSVKIERTITWLAVRFILCFIAFSASYSIFTAATAAQIYTGLPLPNYQFLDTNANPISGGKLYTCTIGSTCTTGSFTTQATYTTYVGNVPNTNPVVLDSAGRATIFFSSAVPYKLLLTDSAGVTINGYPVDGVRFGGVDSLTGTGNQVTVSASTGSPVISLAGPHAFTTQTQYGVIYGNATGALLATSAAGVSSSVLIGTPGTAPSFSNSPTINTLILDSTTFANLGTPSTGTIRFCSNCLANGFAVCVAAGTGALAVRVTGGWIC